MNEKLFRAWYAAVHPGKKGMEISPFLDQYPEADRLLSQALARKKGADWILDQMKEAGTLVPLPPVEPNVVSPVEPSSDDPKTPKKGLSRTWIVIIIAVLAVILLAVGYFIFAQPSFAEPAPTYELAPTYEPALDFATQTPGESLDLAPASPSVRSPDQDFWSKLRQTTVPEFSPGNLGGQLNAKTAVGLFLLLMLTLEAVGEGKIRKKGQNGALFFTIVALMAGWLTMPTLIIIAGGKTVGWFIVGVVFLAILWALTVSTIKSQNDLSPTVVAVAIFTTSLFYFGKLVVITAIGAFFGLVWPAWVGVTSLGGVLTLLMTGRASAAILTVVIVLFGALTIYLASIEVGKKHGHWSALMIGAAIILIFFLTNWGGNSAVAWLMNTQNPSVTVIVVLKILVPVLAWLISLVSSIGIGVAMGDVEVGRSENRQTLGLERTGTFIQNIADFMILGTIIPLFLGVIIVLF